MNTPNNPSNPPSLSSLHSTPPPEPCLPTDPGLGILLDTLLKHPVVLIRDLCDAKSSRRWLLLALVALSAFALYGLVIGSFSGGPQWMAAPVKVGVGALLSALICFPSLYIFACLSGAEVSPRGLAGVLFAMLTLTGLLLLGFAPVAWVFSQSTDSLAFIGTLHLLFWFIATWFGLRLFRHMTKVLGISECVHLKVWSAIFLLVCLQMTTALRPIIGKSGHWLPEEKRFFLAHWVESVGTPASNTRPP